MDDHPRRLVDEHQVLVFVKDIQGNVFRPGRLAGDLRQDDGHPLAFAHAVGGLAAAAVHLGPAGRDDLPQMSAAVILEVDRQEGVQPQARLGRTDRQLDRFGGKQRIGRSFHAERRLLLRQPENQGCHAHACVGMLPRRR